jgi:CBS domain-containing protein
MALTVRDIMTTEVNTVTPSTPLAEFARVCAEDNISGAPVVRVDGSLVGMVSKTDLVRRMLEEEPGPREEDEEEELDLAALLEGVEQVADIMRREVVTVAPDTPAAQVAERMSQERVHRVIVLEGDDLVGIVTSLDLLAKYPRS